jgi:hypothetical protein
MANSLYGKYRQKVLEGSVGWLNDTIKVLLVDTDSYNPQINADEFLSDIPAGARIATSNALTGKTTTLGVADADDTVFPAGYQMPAPTSEALVFFKDTGSPATSPLIAYIDTTTGLPITPNGADINLAFNDGPNRIFSI